MSLEYKSTGDLQNPTPQHGKVERKTISGEWIEFSALVDGSDGGNIKDKKEI